MTTPRLWAATPQQMTRFTTLSQQQRPVVQSPGVDRVSKPQGPVSSTGLPGLYRVLSGLGVTGTDWVPRVQGDCILDLVTLGHFLGHLCHSRAHSEVPEGRTQPSADTTGPQPNSGHCVWDTIPRDHSTSQPPPAHLTRCFGPGRAGWAITA